jgi:thioredoxin-related protein
MLSSALVFLPALFKMNSVFSAIKTTDPAVQKNSEQNSKESDSEKSFWIRDYKKALDQAKRENKFLFIDFTGSDWCGWCTKLNEEVFSTDYFKIEIQRNFIPVEIDFPRYAPVSEAQKAINSKLAEKYEVSGYPTIILADSDEVVFGRTGYKDGGPEDYISHIMSMVNFRKELSALQKEADKLTGLEKAQILHKIVQKRIAASLTGDNKELISQIISLDSDNKAKLKELYTCKAQMEELGRALQKGKDPDEALKKLDELLKIYSQNKALNQDILFFKSMIYARGKNDIKNAAEFLERAYNADPQSVLAPNIKNIMDRIKESR